MESGTLTTGSIRTLRVSLKRNQPGFLELIGQAILDMSFRCGK